KEPILQAQGNMRILLEVPGLENPEGLKAILGRTAKMTFHLMDENNPFPTTSLSVSPDVVVMKGQDEGEGASRNYAIKRQAILSGDMLVDAHASFENNIPVVNFRFNNQGARKFGEVTKDNVGKPFAIVLDNKVISAPVIREPILSGSGMISGNFTVQ